MPTPEPPFPVAARFIDATDRLEVDFNRRLKPGPLNGANWSCRVAGWAYAGPVDVGWRAIAKTAAGPVFLGLPDAGPDKCRYDPPPFDVRSKTSDLPAAAFDDFPLTVI